MNISEAERKNKRETTNEFWRDLFSSILIGGFFGLMVVSLLVVPLVDYYEVDLSESLFLGNASYLAFGIGAVAFFIITRMSKQKH